MQAYAFTGELVAAGGCNIATVCIRDANDGHEVRRLRGEVGRAIFKEDVEREAFGDLLSR